MGVIDVMLTKGKGFCKWGTTCKDSHDDEAVDKKAKNLCKYHRQGYCKQGITCLFSHEDPLGGQPAGPCRYYQSGFCKWGTACKYAHDCDAADRKAKDLCKYHAQGYCRQGDTCKFSHEDAPGGRPAAVLMVKDARGGEVGIIAHVPQGKTTILVTRAGVTDSSQLRGLYLKRPIYLVKEGKFGRGMMKLAACLIMHPDDFQAIEQSVHAGAFGGDYEEVKLDLGSGQAEKWIVLWKLAADLNGINGYGVIPVPQDVGTYGMMDDWSMFQFANPIHIDSPVTKMRYDFQHGAETTSVHHMELESNPDIRFATISTDKFFEDFYEIETHKEELVRVQEMMKALESKANIKSFLCNSQQHQIVFYEDTKSRELLTPVKFAAILNGGDGRARAVKDAIRGALATRGYGGKTYTAADNAERFSTWVNDYVETFSTAVGV